MEHQESRHRVEDVYDEAYAEVYDRIWNGARYDFEFQAIADVLVQLAPNERILDAACGTGLFLQKLAGVGQELHGFDLSDAMLKVAATRVDNVELRVGSYFDRNLYPPVYFGLIVCTYAALFYAGSADAIARALENFHLWLRPGGYLVVDGVDPDEMEDYEWEDGTTLRAPGLKVSARWETKTPGPVVYRERVYSKDVFFENHHQLYYPTLTEMEGLQRRAGFDPRPVRTFPEPWADERLFVMRRL